MYGSSFWTGASLVEAIYRRREGIILNGGMYCILGRKARTMEEKEARNRYPKCCFILCGVVKPVGYM